MKLSEAIIKGAALRPQCTTGFFVNSGSCALGAAYEATTGTVEPFGRWGLVWTLLYEQFPHLQNATICPVGCDTSHQVVSVRGIVTHLNDYHNWTREAIADWVATIEQEGSNREVV